MKKVSNTTFALADTFICTLMFEVSVEKLINSDITLNCINCKSNKEIGIPNIDKNSHFSVRIDFLNKETDFIVTV